MSAPDLDEEWLALLADPVICALILQWCREQLLLRMAVPVIHDPMALIRISGC